MKCSKWLVAAIGFLAAISISYSASAASIAWVSFHAADNAPSAGAVGQGFLTDAPDKGYTDFLTANGHTVTRFQTIDNATPALLAPLNAFDLVIIGRSVNSGHYQTAAEVAAWHGVSAKIINMAGYTLRNVRLGHTTGGTIPDTGGAGNPTGVVRLKATNPAHPIFAGVSLDGSNTMVNPYTTALPSITNTVLTASLQRGISVNTDPLAGGGVVLANINTAGDGADTGQVIAKWAPGAVLNGAALANHRLAFLGGTREANGTNSEIAGIFDLDADGQRMLLNAIDYMVAIPEPATPALAALAMLGFAAMRRRTR